MTREGGGGGKLGERGTHEQMVQVKIPMPILVCLDLILNTLGAMVALDRQDEE